MVGKLLLMLLLPMAASAQPNGPAIAKDFDYTFYTLHSGIPQGDKALQLLLPRKIKKEGNKLYLMSLNDLTLVSEFTIEFMGMQADKPTELVYQSDKIIIRVSPLYGWIQINKSIWY